VDKHSHHELQKGDFQVSNKGDSLCEQGGERCKGGNGGIGNGHYPWDVMYMYSYSYVFMLIKVVFRL
jgi:hypothetical protein